MRFLSVCSGIEAASAAWKPLGWQPVAFSEIDPFPCAVLAHHYPDVPNLGDMTKFKDWPDHAIDLLCGGTPCQSFSVAGLRKGLDDPRGNLMLTFGAIAAKYRPRWLVWENVPGVLSSNGGRDFGAFLGLLGYLGYGFAYRVLDAQFVRVDGYGRAVPQRRKRVFVVGCLGDWRRAAAVLLEREILRGDPAPRRKTGTGFTPILEAGARTGVSTTDERAGLGIGQAGDPMYTLQAGKQHAVAYGGNNTSGPRDVASALSAHGGACGRMDFESETFVAHTLLGDGFDASEDGTGRGTPLVPLAFAIQERAVSTNLANGPQGAGVQADHAYTLEARNKVQAVAFDLRGREGGAMPEGPHDTANLRAASGGSSRSYVAQPYAVRRLTPRECERLQGFPDDWTAISYRGKPADQCPDGPRYKALGNSWAVNCARWIGRRIEAVEGINAQQEKAA